MFGLEKPCPCLVLPGEQGTEGTDFCMPGRVVVWLGFVVPLLRSTERAGDCLNFYGLAPIPALTAMSCFVLPLLRSTGRAGDCFTYVYALPSCTLPAYAMPLFRSTGRAGD
jgi:hypothetical protein